ncbi:unnamed protein product [Camellia sinensis]
MQNHSWHFSHVTSRVIEVVTRTKSRVILDLNRPFVNIPNSAIELSHHRFVQLQWQKSKSSPVNTSVTQVFPDQHQVFEYLQSYARHFDLLKHIRFNSRVVSIGYEGPSDEEMEAWALWVGTGEPFGSRGKWNITVHHSLSRREHHTEKVSIIRSGYSSLILVARYHSQCKLGSYRSDQATLFMGPVAPQIRA